MRELTVFMPMRLLPMRRLAAACLLVFVSLFCVPCSAPAYTLGATSPGKWGPPVMGTGAAVTYSFMATGTPTGSEGSGPFTALADFMPAGFKPLIESAFNAWAAVANISFTEVTDDGAGFGLPTTSGDIRIGGHEFDGGGGTLAHAYYPPVGWASGAGDIHFDIAENWTLDDSGINLFRVALHEIGHAIGLAHYDAVPAVMNTFYTEDAAHFALQPDDIAGAQFIYGVDPPPSAPEPATLLLVSSGLLGLGLRGHRRFLTWRG